MCLQCNKDCDTESGVGRSNQIHKTLMVHPQASLQIRNISEKRGARLLESLHNTQAMTARLGMVNVNIWISVEP